MRLPPELVPSRPDFNVLPFTVREGSGHSSLSRAKQEDVLLCITTAERKVDHDQGLTKASSRPFELYAQRLDQQLWIAGVGSVMLLRECHVPARLERFKGLANGQEPTAERMLVRPFSWLFVQLF